MSENGTRAKDERRNAHIKQTLEYARELTILADEGEADSIDDGCIVLYSVVRDCAYKIRAQAEREKEAHKTAGRWQAEQTPSLIYEI